MKRIALATVLAAGVLGAALLAARPGEARNIDYSDIEAGRTLVVAGDCAFCHTAEGGMPYAGGRAIETPFGTVYSTNITPNATTGIGAWTDEDFYRAMHEGVAADGSHLYPAFPYPAFTKMTRNDVMAVKAFLDTLDAVEKENRESELIWPMNWRALMAGWNMLFFDEGAYEPDPDKSDQWNRGAYLVEGAGHCGSCHTPRNALGGADEDEYLQGGAVQGWYATDLTAHEGYGVGTWTVEEITEYLKTGSNAHSTAAGPMAEVVANSTQKMSRDDLTAIAIYLGDEAGSGGSGGTRDASEKADSAVALLGEAVFVDNCTACHMADGRGQTDVFPPLAGNATVVAVGPQSVLQPILHGAARPVTSDEPTGLAMPAFDWKLSDKQIAAVATFIRQSWGNDAPPVAVSDVAELRDDE